MYAVPNPRFAGLGTAQTLIANFRGFRYGVHFRRTLFHEHVYVRGVGRLYFCCYEPWLHARNVDAH